MDLKVQVRCWEQKLFRGTIAQPKYALDRAHTLGSVGVSIHATSVDISSQRQEGHAILKTSLLGLGRRLSG